MSTSQEYVLWKKSEMLMKIDMHWPYIVYNKQLKDYIYVQ